MLWWVKDVYRLVLKCGWKASDIGISREQNVVPVSFINKMRGAITLQEHIDRLKDDGMVG